ncbi:TetR/AcrR family transcriptional regulator [Derxia lacustris]|uniref:TetR/AcrR family transcriptional regulator n=1 Tax=Derxia lacustris TaxID=764842 RepID=UPI000A171E8A|nr:TetR family transcriptional regulator [Derxia lacustris]
MRVTKEQAAQNRQALLDAAARLFKERGIDGVGVAEICAAAGLTHGALYKHFADKQELAACALADSFGRGFDRLTRHKADAPMALDDLLARYLTPAKRDNLADACPLLASACEIGRQGEAVSRSYAESFVTLRAAVLAGLPDTPQREALATTIVAALTGAMAISHGVLKTDRELADDVLESVATVLRGLGAAR